MKMISNLVSLLLLLFFTSTASIIAVSSAPDRRQKQHLPHPLHLIPNPKPTNGWVKQVVELPSYANKVPPAPIFSGMVEVTKLRNNQPGVEKVFMHYTLVGNTDPKYDDILSFISGGPGAPTSVALFLEGNSGLQLNADSYTTAEYQRTGIPSPMDRVHGWNELGILIGLDNPPPSGYSYCLPIGPAGNGSSCGTWTDTMAGIAQAEALLVILTEHFPNLLPVNTSRSIYSFAESYGGVYAAAMAEQIFTKPDYARLAARFGGQANGDACMGSQFICGNPMESKPWWFLSFMYGRSQIPDDLWQTLLATCGESTLKNYDPSSYAGACKASYDAVASAAGRNFYTYDLYTTCVNNMFGASEHRRHNVTKQQTGRKYQNRKGPLQRMSPRAARAATTAWSSSLSSSSSLPSLVDQRNLDGYVCMSDSFPVYMRHTAVKQAFGVALDSYFFIADDAEGLPYNFTLQDGFKIWADILLNNTARILPRPAGSPAVRVMAYQGDADPAVLITWTQKVWYEFAKNLTFLSKTREWSNYFLESPKTDPSNPYSAVAGGYVVEWGTKEEKGLLSYMTARGKGHMILEVGPHTAKAIARKFMYRDQ